MMQIVHVGCILNLSYSTAGISIRSRASREESASAGNSGMPFVLDPSRGGTSAYAYCHNCNGEDNDTPWYESHVSILGHGGYSS